MSKSTTKNIKNIEPTSSFSNCWKPVVFSFALGLLVQSIFPGLLTPLVKKLVPIDIEVAENLVKPKSNSVELQSTENTVKTKGSLVAQQYMDEYILKYSRIKLSMDLGCDERLHEDHQKASSLLHALEVTANELGELGNKYLEFVKRMRGETVWEEPLGYDWRISCRKMSATFK